MNSNFVMRERKGGGSQSQSSHAHRTRHWSTSIDISTSNDIIEFLGWFFVSVVFAVFTSNNSSKALNTVLWSTHHPWRDNWVHSPRLAATIWTYIISLLIFCVNHYRHHHYYSSLTWNLHYRSFFWLLLHAVLPPLHQRRQGLAYTTTTTTSTGKPLMVPVVPVSPWRVWLCMDLKVRDPHW